MLLTSPVAFLEETVKSSIWFCNCNSYSCFSLFNFQLKVIKFQNRERQNWDESKQNVQPFSFTGEETLKCEIVFCKRMSHLMLYVPYVLCTYVHMYYLCEVRSPVLGSLFQGRNYKYKDVTYCIYYTLLPKLWIQKGSLFPPNVQLLRIIIWAEYGTGLGNCLMSCQ